MPSWSRGTKDLWRNRDLRVVVTARAVSLLGDQLALIALLLRAQSSGSGAWSVVALLLAGGLPLVLLAPLVGRLVDQIDSRGLLLVSSSVEFGCCLALAEVHATPAVLGLVAALGTGQAVTSATWQALLPGIVGIDRLPAAIGLSQATSTAAGIAAPVLGGVLTGWYGARLPLLLDAASFAMIAVAALAVRTRRGSRQSVASEPRGGWAIVRADRLLLPLVVMLSVFILLGGMVNVVEVFLIRQTLGASAAWYGAVGGGWGIGLLGGALLGGRLLDGRLKSRRFGGLFGSRLGGLFSGPTGLLRVALGSAVGLSVGLAAMGWAPTVGWLLPAVLVGGLSNGLLNLSIGSLVGIRSPEAGRGRVSAIVGGLTSAGQVGALLLGGLLAAVLTPRQVFLLAGLLGVLVPLALGRRLLATVGLTVTPAPLPAGPAVPAVQAVPAGPAVPAVQGVQGVPAVPAVGTGSDLSR